MNFLRVVAFVLKCIVIKLHFQVKSQRVGSAEIEFMVLLLRRFTVVGEGSGTPMPEREGNRKFKKDLDERFTLPKRCAYCKEN